jgi:hypothetical protein
LFEDWSTGFATAIPGCSITACVVTGTGELSANLRCKDGVKRIVDVRSRWAGWEFPVTAIADGLTAFSSC